MYRKCASTLQRPRGDHGGQVRQDWQGSLVGKICCGRNRLADKFKVGCTPHVPSIEQVFDTVNSQKGSKSDDPSGIAQTDPAATRVYSKEGTSTPGR